MVGQEGLRRYIALTSSHPPSAFFLPGCIIPSAILVLDPPKGGWSGGPEPLHRVVLGQVVDDLLAADGHDLVVDEALQHFLQPEFVVGIGVAYGELAEFAGGPLYAEVAGQSMVEGGAINFNEVDLGKLGEDSKVPSVEPLSMTMIS